MGYTYVYVSIILLVLAVGAIAFLYQRSMATARQAFADAIKFKEDAHREIETRRKEMLLEAREEIQRLRSEMEREIREKRLEIQKLERRLSQREETLERRLENLEKREKLVSSREQELSKAKEEISRLLQEQRKELERISGLTSEEAKAALLSQLDQELQKEFAKRIKQVEEDLRLEADRRARSILAQAIQRCAVDQVVQTTVSTVALPNDEMKGRIIGREGRNIRTFETLTGVELIIDDTPEAVVLSAFDPVRREVARIALNNLIADGRIHPARIEEAVARAKQEVDEAIRQAGEQAVFQTGVTGLHPELVTILGKLKFRTSYSQNVLDHSVEVSHLAGVMAAELGANIAVAKRAGLLHDIGKAVDFEVEGAHHVISADLARRYGESEDVVHAIEMHHPENGKEPETIEAILVQCADTISAARPGARRDVLENYIKRLQKLEAIVDSLPGVDKCYAMQAGREIRVMVKPELVDDLEAARLAREAARKIEEELEYPGQIRVTVIRETRAVEIAK
ncbi:MAG: ribonuclease Y [Armatimonadota bacterium]